MAFKLNIYGVRYYLHTWSEDDTIKSGVMSTTYAQNRQENDTRNSLRAF